MKKSSGITPPELGGISNLLKITAQFGGFNDGMYIFLNNSLSKLTGNFCSIEIERDDVLQSIPLTFSRGPNVIVLDFLDGNLVETAVFDTHISSLDSEEFTRLVEWQNPGTIIIIMAKDDCVENLTESAKYAIEELGSMHIRELVRAIPLV